MSLTLIFISVWDMHLWNINNNGNGYYICRDPNKTNMISKPTANIRNLCLIYRSFLTIEWK